MSVSLHQAVREGRVEEVKKLLAQGMDPNARDAERNTALHVLGAASDLSENRRKHIFYLLVSHGVDLTAKNSEGKTVLHIAAKKGQRAFVNFLSTQLSTLVKDFSGRTIYHY